MGICQHCGNDDSTMHSVMGSCLLPVKPGYPKEVEPETDPFIVPLTTSWTLKQKKVVDAVIQDLANYCGGRINARAADIKGLDDRPRQVWSEQQPNVFFEYVAQGMLEDLIHELQLRV